MFREPEPEASQNSVTMENMHFISLFSKSASYILNLPGLLINAS
jgi:hypothetical protein